MHTVIFRGKQKAVLEMCHSGKTGCNIICICIYLPSIPKNPSVRSARPGGCGGGEETENTRLRRRARRVQVANFARHATLGTRLVRALHVMGTYSKFGRRSGTGYEQSLSRSPPTESPTYYALRVSGRSISWSPHSHLWPMLPYFQQFSCLTVPVSRHRTH